MIDAGFTVGSDIASRAGAMYESLKSGLTSNLLMRGFGLSRQEPSEDGHQQYHENSGRSQSEPVLIEKGKVIEPRRSNTLSVNESRAMDEHGAKSYYSLILRDVLTFVYKKASWKIHISAHLASI